MESWIKKNLLLLFLVFSMGANAFFLLGFYTNTGQASDGRSKIPENEKVTSFLNPTLRSVDSKGEGSCDHPGVIEKELPFNVVNSKLLNGEKDIKKAFQKNPSRWLSGVLKEVKESNPRLSKVHLYNGLSSYIYDLIVHEKAMSAQKLVEFYGEGQYEREWTMPLVNFLGVYSDGKESGKQALNWIREKDPKKSQAAFELLEVLDDMGKENVLELVDLIEESSNEPEVLEKMLWALPHNVHLSYEDEKRALSVVKKVYEESSSDDGDVAENSIHFIGRFAQTVEDLEPIFSILDPTSNADASVRARALMALHESPRTISFFTKEYFKRILYEDPAFNVKVIAGRLLREKYSLSQNELHEMDVALDPSHIGN